MKYMLVNVSPGNLQVNLFSPEPATPNRRKLHRMGPVVALALGKGMAEDILPHFEGSIEKAHAAVKHSRDTLNLLRPGMLHTYVCDDAGKPVDVDALLGKKVSKEPVEVAVPPPPPPRTEDTTQPVVDAEQKARDADDAAAVGEAVATAEEGKAMDDLTTMDGVGEATAQKLTEAGLSSFASIAEASLESLEEVLGNAKSAKSVQKQAKKLAK
jgi:predicted flap endonuclease-1-like 5' DNA nuclease